MVLFSQEHKDFYSMCHWSQCRLSFTSRKIISRHFIGVYTLLFTMNTFVPGCWRKAIHLQKKEAQNLKQIYTTTAFFAIRPPEKSYRLLKDTHLHDHWANHKKLPNQCLIKQSPLRPIIVLKEKRDGFQLKERWVKRTSSMRSGSRQVRLS